jgi:UDP-glucose 4-epimerase
MDIKNCNILITGGAGFIGSHLATRLAEHNEVVIFDIFTTGYRKNLEHLQDKDNVKILLIDIRDKDPLMKYGDDGIDYIFHLAAQASVPLSIDDPIYTMENNITGTLNILEAAKDLGNCKVIFSSSAAVYGDAPELPKLETMPVLPKSPYAVTKITGEQFCRVFYETYGLPTVALRYFNVYGPRQDPKSEYAAVVPKFIECAIANIPPTIFGDGEQSRDLIYVDDVVDANIAAALSDKANGQIFNIAHGSTTTVNELATMIAEIANKHNLQPEYADQRAGDIKHSYADISKAQKHLGWKPRSKLKDGLDHTFGFFENRK